MHQQLHPDAAAREHVIKIRLLTMGVASRRSEQNIIDRFKPFTDVHMLMNENEGD